MCSDRQSGTPSEALQNMRQPMPFGRKVKLILRNTWRKIYTRSGCCGNYGEPGC